MALEGDLSDFGMAEILQLIGAGKRTGVMTIHSARDQATAEIYCKEGQVIHALFGEEQGEGAVLRVLTLEAGSFRFQPVEVKCPVTINGTLESLLLEGMRRLDESEVARRERVASRELTAQDLLRTVVEMGASDLHLNVGIPPYIRADGRLKPVSGAPPLSPEEVEHIGLSLLSQREAAQFREHGDLETSYGFPGVGRFRVSVSKQRGSMSVVARCIPFEHIRFEDLGLPDSVRVALEKPAGLVLVTGATGSGKSSTLASMIDYLNRTRACNIITLEDPIEFLYSQKRALIRQRQVGQDTASFADALRHVLRHDPDVVLVGEMRDLETMEGALFAAETGQLVLATLHTTDAPQTINRVVDAFPPRQQEQIRLVLSMVLQAVVTQQLVLHSSGKGRVLAAEVLVATQAVRAMIRDGKVHQIASLMETGMKDGMRTMNQSLLALAERGLISRDQAIGRSPDPEALRTQVDAIALGAVSPTPVRLK